MHHTHDKHDHVHGPNCGIECAIAIDAKNPAACTSGHDCADHAADHIPGDSCGHPAIPHGDHMDYLVDGHLHHPHGGHCDDHGAL